MSDDTSLFLMILKDKIPRDSIFYLKESLEKASKEQRQKLFFVKIKNPSYGLLFGFLLFGLDRIYKGDIILGVIKMVFAFFSYFGFIISYDIFEKAEYSNFPTSEFQNEIGVIIFFAFLIIIAAFWVITDYFLVWKGICKDNLKRIFEILQ